MGPATNLRSHVPEDEAARYRQLFNAVRSGETQTVTALLAQGMDVNLRGPRGATPLHIAARFGQNSMVDLLLSHGANVAALDDSGKSPFDKARASSTGGAIAARLAQTMPAAELAATTTAGPWASPASATLPLGAPVPAPGDDALASLFSTVAVGGGDAPLAPPPPSAAPPAPHDRDEAVRCRRLLESAFRGETAKLEEILSLESALVAVRGPRGATALHVAARYGQPTAVALHASAHHGALSPLPTGTATRRRWLCCSDTRRIPLRATTRGTRPSTRRARCASMPPIRCSLPPPTRRGRP